MRNVFVNRVEYLADRAVVTDWYLERDRGRGVLAKKGNGLLTRIKPVQMEDHKLPCKIPGRGAVVCQFGKGEDALCLVIVHLSLGRRDRRRQLSYIAEIIADFRHVVLMGDMNVHHTHLLDESPLRHSNLLSAEDGELRTYASWRPR